MASSDETLELDMPPLEDGEPMNTQDVDWEDDDEDDQDDDCDGEDLTKGPVKCLFCSNIMESAEDVFFHCQKLHNFNLFTICQHWQLDCIGYIKLINFIRSKTPSADFLNQLQPGIKPPWENDMYMKPVDPDDLLLQYDIESEDVGHQNVAQQPESFSGTLSCTSASTTEELSLQAQAVIDELIQRLRASETRVVQAEAELQRLLCDKELIIEHSNRESEDIGHQNVAQQPESFSGTHSCTSASTTEELSLRAQAVTDELIQRLHASETRAVQAETRAVQAEAELQRLLCDVEHLRAVARDLVLSGSGGAGDAERDEGKTQLGAIEQLTVDEDDAYFSSYARISIHTEMLEDKVRTESYRDFMLKNSDILKDKVVLDVGCGTGILSMFAVKAGARHVIGVDQSEIIYQAMDIARENGLQDKITFLKGRLEDITLPVEFEKVDIIVSEWMGYFLLFESMLDTVLVARDRFLKPGGCVYPDKCTLSLVGIDDQEMHQRRLGRWNDVYGFRMTCLKTKVYCEADVEVVSSSKLLTDPCCIKGIDVNTCSLDDLQFSASFSLECHREGQMTAVIGYFDIGFESECSQKIHFSTGPASTPTHWKQTIFLLPQPLPVTKGTKVEGSIRLKKNRRDPRSLVILLTLNGKAREYFME
ncbi:hypothetical protein C0Q70_11806 [Pomacea canaliculata]|uniref:type I protein arginine methyltransferase n=1 Tax=Pomacea canaliculata TaxID=400727 RepID=A0A2T7P725_POMCA|nr:protein arginine N-methyltransferase 3-like [Pomacea canaliculata]PVD29209.1 hypothetical protein C0Q70_11806 [Pomacea canaliculata]